MSREIHLVSYPIGLPTEANFSVVTTDVAPLLDGQVLVRNLFMSVDPYMRGRMTGRTTYVPPFELNRPLDGGAVGEVIESRSELLKSGDAVLSRYGWREYFTAAPSELQIVDRSIEPLSVYLGALGMPGMTAWVGLNLVDVKQGDVVYISGAAGAVGSVAGQLAKLRGCQTIGSAGSSDKVNYLVDECHYDDAFNYKYGVISNMLTQVAPNGIDVYFDNVGGESLEAALTAMRPHGRIIACGGISQYNAEKPVPGPANLFNMITKRLTWKGFIVSDSIAQMPQFISEVGGYFREGKLRNRETILQGIERAPEAFIGLFTGENIGKMVVDLN